MPSSIRPEKLLLLLATDAETRIRDRAVSIRASSLCRAMHAWMTSEPRSQLNTQWLVDARELLQSKFLYALLAGAHCAGVIAMEVPEMKPWLVEVFRSSGVRARCLMLRYSVVSTPQPDSAGDQLILLGLRDRARSVQEWACQAAAVTGERRYSPAMRACVAKHPTVRQSEIMKQYISILERGYWLSAPNGSQHREYLIQLASTLVASRVPCRAFAELSEQDVMRHVIDSYRHPRGESAAWLSSLHDQT